MPTSPQRIHSASSAVATNAVTSAHAHTDQRIIIHQKSPQHPTAPNTNFIPTYYIAHHTSHSTSCLSQSLTTWSRPISTCNRHCPPPPPPPQPSSHPSSIVTITQVIVAITQQRQSTAIVVVVQRVRTPTCQHTHRTQHTTSNRNTC